MDSYVEMEMQRVLLTAVNDSSVRVEEPIQCVPRLVAIVATNI